MEYAQDLDGIAADTVRDNISSLVNDKFASARNPTRAAQTRLFRKPRYRIEDALYDKACGVWII